ncbi:MAG: CoA-binding protein [Microthrixaceae bacterium]
MIVAGASTHPGKFGFVALHNLLASGYRGKVFATNRNSAEVLGVSTVGSIEDIPPGEADLVVVCTPKDANVELLEQCARIGVRAAFVTTAGYGESGEQGRTDEAELVEHCRRLGIRLAGPNGQGVVSTPSSLCAQIVAPYPPAGPIGVASQSGNFVSSFLNLASASGVGISRGVGRQRRGDRDRRLPPLLRRRSRDGGGSRLPRGHRRRTRPLRHLADHHSVQAGRDTEGGATTSGARAASSHTGSLATDDRVFDGACRQAGVTRAATVEQAYEAAATLATQPLRGVPESW